MSEEIREKLADYAHRAWAGWMIYLFDKSTANPDGTVTIPAWAVERWSRQIQTNYNHLSEDEKKNDLHEADVILNILRTGEEKKSELIEECKILNSLERRSS